MSGLKGIMTHLAVLGDREDRLFVRERWLCKSIFFGTGVLCANEQRATTNESTSPLREF